MLKIISVKFALDRTVSSWLNVEQLTFISNKEDSCTF